MASMTRTPAVGWYYGWTIVAVCVLSQVAAYGVPSNCLTLFLRPWSTAFHVPISQILLATLPMSIFTSVSAAMIGPLADKVPARLLMGLGLAGLALFALIGSAAGAAWQIEALYALLIPVPLVLSTAAVCNPLVSRWFVKRLGLAIGVTGFGLGLGGVVLPPLIAGVMPLIGWRSVWRISAAFIALVVLPIVLLLLRERPTEREGLHYVAVDAATAGQARAHGHGGHGGGSLRTLDILKRKNFWFVVAVCLPLGSIFVGGHGNIAPLVLSRGFGQATAGLLLSVMNLSNVASVLIMGLLSDRFGNRIPLVILAATTGVSGLFLGLGGGLAPLVAGTVLAGFAGGIWTILPAAAAVEFGPANTGRVFGLFWLIIPIHALMSSVIARVKEVTGSYSSIFIALSAFCFLGGVIVLFMRERRDREQ